MTGPSEGAHLVPAGLPTPPPTPAVGSPTTGVGFSSLLSELHSLGTVAVPGPDDLWRRLLPVVIPAGGGSRTPADASGRVDSFAPSASSLPSPGSGLRPGAGGILASGGGE